MEIKLHDFKNAEIAKQAVDLIASHFPKGDEWKIASVEIGSFAHSIDIVVQLPHKQRSSMGVRWTLDDLIHPANRGKIKTEIGFFALDGVKPCSQVRLRHLVAEKDVIVTIPANSANELVTFIINF